MQTECETCGAMLLCRFIEDIDPFRCKCGATIIQLDDRHGMRVHNIFRMYVKNCSELPITSGAVSGSCHQCNADFERSYYTFTFTCVEV